MIVEARAKCQACGVLLPQSAKMSVCVTVSSGFLGGFPTLKDAYAGSAA